MPDLENPVVTDDATTPDVAPETPTINYYHPEWFSHGEYLNNKVIECDLIAFQDKTDWNNTSVLAALTAAGQSPYENWVEYGNANNVSPSPFFNVPQYLQFKANQLNSFPFMDEVGWLGHRPATGTVWTMMDVLESFREAGLSAWDHYTQYGQFENINPSNNFDQAAFWTAKVAQLNAWENADGTTGFDGKTDWDEQAVKDYFQANNLNAIMNLYDNSKEDQQALINQVAPLQQVETNGWQPWGDHVYPLPIDYTVVDIATLGDSPYNLGDGNTDLQAVWTGNEKDSTIKQSDVIDGGAGQDKLSMTISKDFAFKDGGKMSGVETVDLTTPVKSKAVTVDTTDFGNVQTYNLFAANAPISLKNLASTDITVNENDLAGGQTSTIGFANAAVSGTNDSLNLGVKNVGTMASNVGTTQIQQQAATVIASGIEILNIAATGDNVLSLGGAQSNVQTINVSGDGDLILSGAGSSVKTFDASKAKGDVEADLTGATQSTIKGGFGDDTITTSNITANAVLDGGYGTNDTFVYGGNGKFAPTMSGFENITFNSGKTVNAYFTNINDVITITVDKGTTLNGTDMDNFATLTVKDNGATQNTITLNGGDYDLTYVATGGKVTAAFNAGTEGDVTISDSGTATIEATSAFTFNNTDSVTINTANAAVLTTLNAGNATTLSINNDDTLSITNGDLSSVTTMTVDATNTFGVTADIGTNAEDIDITLSGTGAITMDANIGGAHTETVTINAEGAMGAVQAGNPSTPAYITTETLVYTGGVDVDTVCAKVSGTGTTIETGAGSDLVSLTIAGATAAKSGQTAMIDAGAGDDNIFVTFATGAKGLVTIDNWNTGDELNFSSSLTGKTTNWTGIATKEDYQEQVKAVLASIGVTGLENATLTQALTGDVGIIVNGSSADGLYIMADYQTAADGSVTGAETIVQILGATSDAGITL